MFLKMNPQDNLASFTFPQRLYKLLENESNDCVTWAPQGIAFYIIDQTRFSEQIIPKYFKQSKLASFQRQLNLYGFKRLNKGTYHGAYFHPKFQKGKKELIREIVRLPTKESLKPIEKVMEENGIKEFSSLQPKSLNTKKIEKDLKLEERDKIELKQKELSSECSSDSGSNNPNSSLLSSHSSSSAESNMSKLSINLGLSKVSDNIKGKKSDNDIFWKNYYADDVFLKLNEKNVNKNSQNFLKNDLSFMNPYSINCGGSMYHQNNNTPATTEQTVSTLNSFISSECDKNYVNLVPPDQLSLQRYSSISSFSEMSPFRKDNNEDINEINFKNLFNQSNSNSISSNSTVNGNSSNEMNTKSYSQDSNQSSSSSSQIADQD